MNVKSVDALLKELREYRDHHAREAKANPHDLHLKLMHWAEEYAFSQAILLVHRHASCDSN